MFVGFVVVFMVVFIGCSVINGILGNGDVDCDEEIGQVIESFNVGVFVVKFGDCMMDMGIGVFIDVNIFLCDELYDQEVYYEIMMDDGDYVEDNINVVFEECIGDVYILFVGVVYQDFVFDVMMLMFIKELWEQVNDCVIQCIIFDFVGQIEGLLVGVGC